MKQSQFVNEPPEFRPPMEFIKQKHLFVRYSVGQISAVIRWCEKEYWDSLTYWSKRGAFKNVKLEAREFSYLRLMSFLSAFDDIVNFLKQFPFVWDALPRQTRKFLASAYEFKTLSNQRVSEV